MNTNQFQSKNRQEPIRVAFADDHNVFRISYINWIERQGDIKVVISVEDGLPLLKELSTSETLPDVCIVDIYMPGMDGRQTIEAIRQEWAKLKIIVLTGFNDDHYLKMMVKCGANAYISKQAHPEEVRNAIIHLTDHRYFFNDILTQDKLNEIVLQGESAPSFSEMELHLLRLSPQDLSYKELAVLMGTTKKSVESCGSRLFKKLNIRSRPGLASYAIQHGYAPKEKGINNL